MDSDMIVMRNMDELMDFDLPEGWIAAAHACACNPRKLKHYPADWYVVVLDRSNQFLCDRSGSQRIVHTPRWFTLLHLHIHRLSKNPVLVRMGYSFQD